MAPIAQTIIINITEMMKRWTDVMPRKRLEARDPAGFVSSAD